MTARYATGTVHFHNTATGKDVTIQAGAEVDSATQGPVQVPAMFSAAPVTTLPPAVTTYLTGKTAGP
jgi:hypothetical protein